MGPPGRVGTLAVVLTIGCNPLTTIGFLTHKDRKPAKYPARLEGRAEEGQGRDHGRAVRQPG